MSTNCKIYRRKYLFAIDICVHNLKSIILYIILSSKLYSMKKILLLALVIFIGFGYSFAITQTVNETNGVNYGYIKDVYKRWSTYYLSVDYIQYYQWYEAALARIDDGIIFWDLSTMYDQDYNYKYYYVEEDGQRFSTQVAKKAVAAYLKNGKKKFNTLIKRLNDNNWNPESVFNNLSEVERMVAWPSFDPATWWGGNYTRNTNTKIRNIPFASSATITVEWETMSLSWLLSRVQSPTQMLTKVFLKRGKIEWFRVEYQP